jgi:penicillin-binding protein 1A
MLDIITQFWRNIRSWFSKKKFWTSPAKFSYASKHHHFAQRRGSTLYSPIGQKSSPSLFFSRAYLPYIIIAIVWIPLIFLIVWLYLNVFRDLPRISDIQSKSFSQASVITDRNGNELYKIFDENREYIEFDQMSPHFVNAIVAIEDQRFWTNRGIDIYGIARAAIKNVWWWSTITQQLIKNLLLSSEKKYSRKIKEILLALQINNFIAKDIASNHGDLAQKDLDRKVKEKILELYANYIFLGNNAYGLETAAKTYFWISAKDLSIVQASIIAGLPQAPSTYDPYTNRRAIAWELEINVADEDQSISDETKWLIYDKVKQEIATAKFSSRSNETELLKFMSSLLDFTYELDGKQYQIKYYTWRKDLVLIRMYLDAYITEDQLKDALFEWFTLSFTRAKTNILAPHFVFWVMNQLEQQFDSEVLRKWWLVIKTTLDLDTQKLAEESVTENDPGVVWYGASNAAMVYIDSLQGDILAYVWSKDYFNQEIGWENDLVQSPRQVGSIMKPLLYAMWFMELPLAIDSPIYDLSMDIAGNTPENSDGKFSWLTTLKSALAASRNIPAIKLFLMIGWEIPFKIIFEYQLGELHH